jgi:hypothetical protein
VTEVAAITKFLENPRNFNDYIRETKDFQKGFQIVDYIYGMVKGADSIMDIIIKAMEVHWVPEEHEGESFYDAMVRNTELAPVTIMRHTRVGEMLEIVPPEYRPQIEGMDVKSKVAMTDTVLDGHELSDDQWSRVANARNYQDVAEVVREVKQVAPRSQWMKFTIDEHDIVWVHTAEGKFEFFRINGDSEIVDVIERAKKRLLRQANILPEVRY